MDSDVVVRRLARHSGTFRVRPVGSEDVWNARWRYDLTIPSYRIGGTNGWVDYDVCSFDPCTKVHPETEQQIGLSAPVHVRLLDQDPGEGGEELGRHGRVQEEDNEHAVGRERLAKPGPLTP